MEQTPKYNIFFWGTSAIAVPVLEELAASEFAPQLVVTQPDTITSKKQTPSPVRATAEQLRFSVLTPRSPKEIKQNTSERPDVCVLMAYGSIISSDLLAWPRYGWINIHPSVLPLYRGASPIQQVILDGAHESGVTIISMDAGIDTGAVVCQEKIPVHQNDTSITLGNRLATLAASMSVHCLQAYLDGSVVPTPQPAVSPTPITKRIKKNDGRIFKNLSAQQIERMVRAYNSWPGVHALVAGKRIKITDVMQVEDSFTVEPGVFVVSHNRLFLQTQTTALEILQLQPEGKKILSADAYLRGYGWIHGTAIDQPA